MRLLTLTAENFRNFEKLNVSFEAPVVAFVGANAQGKTNILESIGLLAFGKSLRAEEEKSLIRQGAEFFRVVGEVETEKNEKFKLEIAATVSPRFTKTIKFNRRPITASELVGQLPIVQFFPEDLNLALLAPGLRRRYLNILLSQISKDYLRALSGYQKALRNRNALLARIATGLAKTDELEFWDQELARHGLVLGKSRLSFLDFATQKITARFQEIASEKKNLTIRLSGFHAEDLTAEKYLENLTKLREQDLRYGITNYGPHRADLVFELENKMLAENGSRGEIRSAILALKFVELEFLEKQTAKKPLLLLDDVFSELDRNRQENLLQLIEDHQTFITTTKLEHLDTIKDKKQVWEVRSGKLGKM